MIGASAPGALLTLAKRRLRQRPLALLSRSTTLAHSHPV